MHGLLLFPYGLTNGLLFLAAGIAFAAGLQNLVLAACGHRRAIHLHFSMLCILVALFLCADAALYATTSVQSVAAILRFRVTVSLIFLPFFVAFLASYTYQRNYAPWIALISVICGCLVMVNLTMTPYSLRFTSLAFGPPIQMPWGESLKSYTGQISFWNVPLRALFASSMAWGIYRAWVMHRIGKQRTSLLLAGALAMMFMGLLAGALIELGYLQTIYPVGPAFLSMILFMDVALSLDLIRANRSLSATTNELIQRMELQQKAEERARHVTAHDLLTNLPNRFTFVEALDVQLNDAEHAGKHGAVILFGLDNFRVVNEVLGHHVGDDFLRQVAKRVGGLDVTGGQLFRVADDEFALLLECADCDIVDVQSRAWRCAEQCMASINLPFLHNGEALRLGSCAGITHFPVSGDSPAFILQRADLALQNAKAFGKGRIQFFEPDMQAAVSVRMKLEQDMQNGLNRGEFVVYFQPQVSPQGEVLGAEALLRWRHPHLEHVSPATFIPIAEQSGVICSIGEWVLRQVCEQIRAFDHAVPEFKGHISVNVSAQHFMRQDYEEEVRRCIAMHGTDAQRLTLEITESAFIRGMDEAIAKINALRSMGIGFSIDDFGTGYSSLSYLRRLPVDELKIDQAFIRNLDNDDRDVHLVETIVMIGEHMGMRVVAEGVESRSQAELLGKLNCWALQGYHLARPMTGPDFIDWLSARTEAVA